MTSDSEEWLSFERLEKFADFSEDLVDVFDSEPKNIDPENSDVSKTRAIPYLDSRILICFIWTQGRLTLKDSVSCANHTILTFVMMKDPKFPCSAERFQTP